MSETADVDPVAVTYELPARTRAKLTPWPNGVSGNPSGMPKHVAGVVALAREHTTGIIGVLADIAYDKNAHANARVAAIGILLDRGWGKAPAVMLVDVAVKNLDGDALDQAIRREMAALAAAKIIDVEPETD